MRLLPQRRAYPDTTVLAPGLPVAPRLLSLTPALLTLACLLLGAAPARADSAYLVRDLAPGSTEQAEVAPSNLFVAGNRAFFCGLIGSSYGLWVSDGTAAGTQPLAIIQYGIVDPCTSSTFLSAA
ncbi:MAG: hypothetical protein JOZ15_13040, partial [Acidobacteria bacterium]|nr:hypothetical protein [Acidobacteriota bacterium]